MREARVHPISLSNLEEDNKPVSGDAVRIAEEFDGALVQALWTLIFSVQSRINQYLCQYHGHMMGTDHQYSHFPQTRK